MPQARTTFSKNVAFRASPTCMPPDVVGRVRGYSGWKLRVSSQAVTVSMIGMIGLVITPPESLITPRSLLGCAEGWVAAGNCQNRSIVCANNEDRVARHPLRPRVAAACSQALACRFAVPQARPSGSKEVMSRRAMNALDAATSSRAGAAFQNRWSRRGGTRLACVLSGRSDKRTRAIIIGVCVMRPLGGQPGESAAGRGRRDPRPSGRPTDGCHAPR